MLDYHKKIKPEVKRILFMCLKHEYREIKIKEPYCSEIQITHRVPQPAEALLIREAIREIVNNLQWDRSVNKQNFEQKCQSEIEKYRKKHEKEPVIKNLFL